MVGTAVDIEEKARILVVEDEGVIAMDLVQNLGDFGYEVVGSAVSGESAIALAREMKPDLILMDIVIKGAFDGIETARRIRAEFDIPVVFLTAYGDDATLERAKKTAPYGYLLKPYRPDALRAATCVALYKHRLEAQLSESEQWFAKTLHCVSDGVIATDRAGKVRFMNPVAEKLTGSEGIRALGRQIEEVCCLLDEHTREVKPNPIARALASGVVTEIETSLIAPVGAGAPVPVDDGAAPIRDERGTLLGGVFVVRDLTERRHAEEALRQSEERFHTAFDHAAIGMALVSTGGQLLQANRALGELLGRSDEELRGAGLDSLLHPEHAVIERAALAQLDADDLASIRLEKLFLHKSGAPLWGLLSLSAVRGSDRRPNYYILQLHRIEERKRTDGQEVAA